MKQEEGPREKAHQRPLGKLGGYREAVFQVSGPGEPILDRGPCAFMETSPGEVPVVAALISCWVQASSPAHTQMFLTP